MQAFLLPDEQVVVKSSHRSNNGTKQCDRAAPPTGAPSRAHARTQSPRGHTLLQIGIGQPNQSAWVRPRKSPTLQHLGAGDTVFTAERMEYLGAGETVFTARHKAHLWAMRRAATTIRPIFLATI